MKTKFRLLTWVLLLAIAVQDVFAITKVTLVNHTDPFYMDRCLEITGELCDYCCLDDFEWCSRDIYNCQPTFNRNLIKMYQRVSLQKEHTLTWVLRQHLTQYHARYVDLPTNSLLWTLGISHLPMTLGLLNHFLLIKIDFH